MYIYNIWIHLIATASLGRREMNSVSGPLLRHLYFLTVLVFQVKISIPFRITIWTSNYIHKELVPASETNTRSNSAEA